MGLVLLIAFLVLAAAAGVLGAVLKATLVLVMSLVLAVVVLAWLATWYVRRRVRGFQRDVERRFGEVRRRRTAYDVTPPGDATPRGPLGDGS
jgi:threonine/homoserine/homoserine lactone efflux protein